MASPVVSQRSSDTPGRERIEVLLGHLDELPTLPAVAARLLSVTASEKASARDVAEVISSDASLTAAILRMLRRSDRGVRAEGLSVDRAVGLLGFSTVRNAVLSARLFQLFSSAREDAEGTTLRASLWKHNLAVGCAAEKLAPLTKHRLASGTAFVCGLLHDVGKLALDACIPRSYRRVLGKAVAERLGLCDVERAALGLDHTVAGKRVAGRWMLPQPIVECVQLHHQPMDPAPSFAQHWPLVQLVTLANQLAKRHRIGYCDGAPAADVEDLSQRLGLDAQQLDQVIEELPRTMEPLLALLDDEGRDGGALYADTLAGANRELGRLNSELAKSNRRLRARSVAFEVFRGWTDRLSAEDTISDVLLASARGLAETCDASAVAFCGTEGSRQLHVGWSAAPTGDAAALAQPSPAAQGSNGAALIDLDDQALAELLANVRGATATPPGGTAPVACEGLWQRCLHAPPESLCLLPFTQGRYFGGLLVAQNALPTEDAESTKDLAALGGAVGLAARWAHARAQTERVSEDLLDVNRRLHVAQRELVRARSIAMIGQMAAGAAHELNNPLAVISGRAQMLAESSSDENTVAGLRLIREQAHRASQIVQDLMSFAKPDPPQPTSRRLQEVLQAACQRWCGAFGLHRAQVLLMLVDDNVSVFVDPAQLDGILDALVDNARHAARGRALMLKINSASRASDETVRIEIEDNGAGMNREVLEHAFDPFFSSRPAGRGRGLGLSHAYRLATINGGKLCLDSTVNVGTTATLELPARPPAATRD